MLRRLTVRDFKSFENATVAFPRLAVFFGPNSVGKSNLLDAIQMLSRIGTGRTLSEAMGWQIRGHPIEMFRLPAGGLPAMLAKPTAQFGLEADLTVSTTSVRNDGFRYSITVEIATESGGLTNCDEFLSALNKKGQPMGSPAIIRDGDRLRIHRQTGGRPRLEDLGQNYAILSDPRLGRPAYRHIERVRDELADWRTYYLDPRVSMRRPMPPRDVHDIGVYGQFIAPFLHKLKSQKRRHFDTVLRTVRTIIPSIETIDIDLDERRGTLDLFVQQGGTSFSSRVVSEGTLRVLALCTIAVNPWNGSLIAFEEPENGVHPRRTELIAQLLVSLATEGQRQVIVTTHSPLFCNSVFNQARTRSNEDVALFTFHNAGQKTEIKPFSSSGPLFQLDEVSKELTSSGEDGVFEGLVLRGLVDE